VVIEKNEKRLTNELKIGCSKRHRERLRKRHNKSVEI